MDALTQARRLLDAIGPGRMLLVGPEPEALAIELRRLGCSTAGADPAQALAGARPAGRDAQPLDAVLWLWGAATTSLPSAAAVQRLGGSTAVLALLRAPQRAAPPATTLLQAAFAGGWRRSPRQLSLAHCLAPAEAWTELVLEAVPAGPGTPALPAASIDPTREAGPRADALLARHALAAEQVRPGDHVLVLGCGSGAGAAVLAQRSRCGRITAVDADAANVAYARRHFAVPDRVAFEVGAPARLEALAPRSVDCVVAFDVFGDAEGGAAAVLAEVARVLKPDGRLVAGFSAGPAAAAIEHRLAEGFLVEARLRQPPGERHARPGLERIALEQAVPEGGWRLLVASADPLGADAAGFALPEFARSAAAGVPVTDFAAHYDNPWLYRPMVQMGQRLQDEALLTDFALKALAHADGASADAGAALCVLAYQVLGRRRADQVENLLPLIEAYAAQASTNPHVRRWQISLEFAAALACLTTGEPGRADSYFERVLARDPLGFSPLLSTKLVAAAFWLGIRRLVGREPARARACFEAGVQAAARALQAPLERSVGSLAAPNTFGFQELAEVADMASQCAQALDALPHFETAPGRFWRQVDTRRFGFATWLQHLERENRALREQLQRASAR